MRIYITEVIKEIEVNEMAEKEIILSKKTFKKLTKKLNVKTTKSNSTVPMVLGSEVVFSSFMIDDKICVKKNKAVFMFDINNADSMDLFKRALVRKI